MDFERDSSRLFRREHHRAGGFLRQLHAHTLDRVVASLHFRDDTVQFVAVQHTAVADLPSGFGVERRVVEDDFALLAFLQFVRALASPGLRGRLKAMDSEIEIEFGR